MYMQRNPQLHGFMDMFGSLVNSAAKEGTIADAVIKGSTAVLNAKAAAKSSKDQAKAAKYQAIADSRGGYTDRSGYYPPTDTGAFRASDLVGGQTGMMMLGLLGVAGVIYFAVAHKKPAGRR